MTKKHALILFYILISLIFTLPIFKNILNWGVWDWDLDFFYQAVPRTTILEYKQFPLWNPYYNGGTPLLANPQSRFLTPFFLIILLFGEIIGIKILILLHLIIGLLGTYLLARHYKINNHKIKTIPAIFSSFIYMLSTTYSLPIASGMSSFMFYSYIPWIFLYFLKSFKKFNFIFISILFLLLMFLGGGIQLFSLTFTFLAFYSGLLIIFKKHPLKQTLKIFITLIMLTCLLGAVKLLPAIEFINQYPRKIKTYSGYSLNSLYYSLFNRNQSIDADNKFPFKAQGFLDDFSLKIIKNNKSPGIVLLSSSTLIRIYNFADGMSAGMNENGMYIGLLPFLFFCFGFVKYFKNPPVLALSFIFLVWLSFGSRLPIKSLRLWDLLTKLPIYNTMRVSQRFRFVFMLILALFAGFGLQAVIKYLNKKLKNKTLGKIFVLSLLIFVFLDLLTVNSFIFKEAFPIKPIKLEKSKSFYQIWRNPKYDKSGFAGLESDWHKSRSSLYPTFLANIGTVCGYEPMPVPRNALFKDNEKYKSEVYLKNTQGKALITKWTPNRITIQLSSKNNGYLVLNQNYYSGWKIKNSNKTVEPVDKLLGVKVTPNDKEIEFYYLPTSFIIGLIISLATLILLLTSCYKNIFKLKKYFVK